MAESTASQIIDAVGGPGNIKSLTHCATRLRFELVDAGKVDQNRLEHMKGVLGAVPQSGDRYQVVIGGGVATMYDKIMQLPEMANIGGGEVNNDGSKKLSNAEVKAQERSKVKGKHAWVDNFFEFLSDKHSALAVVFYFLTVKAVAAIVTEFIVKTRTSRHGKRYSFIRGAEEYFGL